MREVAERMNYHPDPSAAALAAGRTHTIAMAVPLLGAWYFSQVMAGSEAVLSEAGYDLLLFTVDTETRRRRLLGGPLVKRADGLILVDLRVPDDEARNLVSGGVKVVSIGIEIEAASSVMVDDFQIAYDAVTHLIELGHRAIALMGGLPGDPLRFPVPERRSLGYRTALEDNGITPRLEYEIPGNFTVEGGRVAMATLLDLGGPPTAVFAMSDEMAFGALREISRRDMRCPDDVSIVGVDDHEFSEVIGLTTVQQQVAEHGAVAARLLLGLLSDPDAVALSHTAETSFIHRSTTSRLDHG